ncbi:MAG: hypothetical protein RID53_18370 [Coleofasciculus sp. B1-GNL1-01]|uniref:hypothetical protein n=1 Tax=Coleofasciculus sp. B1-GNL1-01 TaxID=3068484 RepID=UPI0032FF6209
MIRVPYLTDLSNHLCYYGLLDSGADSKQNGEWNGIIGDKLRLCANRAKPKGCATPLQFGDNLAVAFPDIWQNSI